MGTLLSRKPETSRGGGTLFERGYFIRGGFPFFLGMGGGLPLLDLDAFCRCNLEV